MLLNDSAKSFFKIFLMGLFLAPALMMVFNIIVDPFGVFRVVEIKGFNKEKPQFAHRLRMAKACVICRLRPDAAIFGSSRAELGINPEHPSFQNYKSVYNASMAGAGIGEIFKTLKHTYYASGKNLKLAIIGLDFLMFNMNREKIVIGTEVIDYDEKRLILEEGKSCLNTFLHDIDFYLLRKATIHSLKTVLSQSFNHEIYLKNGQRDQKRSALYTTGMPNAGHRAAFINNERYYMQKIWTAGAEQRYCTHSMSDGTSTLNIFRDIILFARKNGIKLRFYTSPTHARLLIAIREAGLWSQLEGVKRGMVQILKEDSEKFPNSSAVELWDFMNFNANATESVPLANDKKTAMVWHWETSHYKESVGDKVLNRIMGYEKANQKIANNFGVLLTSNNIEEELTKLLHDSKRYDITHINDVKEIQQLAKEVLGDRVGTYCSKSYALLQEGLKEKENKNDQRAKNLFNDAEKAYYIEKNEAIKKNIPFREIGTLKIIQQAKMDTYEKPLENWIAYQERGNKRKAEGKLKDALNDYNEAIKKSPPNAALHFVRGMTCFDLKDYQNAKKDFNAILKLDANNAAAKHLLERIKIILNNQENDKA